jgi:hypothetical protein
MEQKVKIHVDARAAHFVEKNVLNVAISKAVVKGIYR